MIDETSPVDTAPSTHLTFESPTGHAYFRDVDHQGRPRTRLMEAGFEQAMADGFADTFSRYGLPLSHAELVHVHGWGYLRMVPVGGPDRPGAGAPPPVVLKVLTRLSPELRRRERRARQALEGRLWLRDAETWAHEREAWAARFAAHDAVDLAACSDDQLADELAGRVATADDMARRHFELIGPGLAVGLLLAAAEELDVDRDEVIEALRGASPASVGTLPIVHGLVREVGEGPVPDDLDGLRAVSDRAAALVDEHEQRFGRRLLGDDVDQPTVGEQPRLLVEAVRRAVEDGESARPTDAAVPPPEEGLPDGATPELRRLLGEARACFASLDDNSGYVAWAYGLVRIAALEAGRRLTAAGTFTAVDDVFLLAPDELGRLLRGDGGELDLAARRDEARDRAAAEPPVGLGGQPPPPPSPDAFPPAMRRFVAAVGRYIDARMPTPAGAGGEVVETGRVLVDGRVVATGHGVGASTATGRAVVAADAAEAIDRIEPGDVLVCPFTSPAYNAVFPLLAGVATETGGPLGHTGVLARELGIPAVVGTGPLAVDDGATVTVEAGATASAGRG